MGDKSAIEWTEATWNVVTGCTKVSEGCRHCYIERTPPFRTTGRRFTGPDGPGEPGATTGVVLHPDRLTLPLRWRKPRRVFVNSLADLFHDDVPDEFIAHTFGVMGHARQHTFQVLTKRPGRMASLLNSEDFQRSVSRFAWYKSTFLGGVHTWPLSNVWLGVSVESQKWADVRIPPLLRTPPAVRFLSCEPLLSPVDLEAFLLHPGCRPCSLWRDAGASGPRPCAEHCPPPLDWVIVGGESGPGARPMHPQWARDLRDQCRASGVAYFFKQWGEWAPAGDLDPDVRERAPEQLAGDEYVCRVGKKRAGRELDGREWSEYPREVAR